MLEKVGVGHVGHQLQDLENEVGARLTKASGAGLGYSWIVFVLEAVGTNLACFQLPLVKATCGCVQNIGKVNGCINLELHECYLMLIGAIPKNGCLRFVLLEKYR